MPKRLNPAPVGGSQPEEQYAPATRKSMHLDKPTSHGGWPAGEYDPPAKEMINIPVGYWLTDDDLTTIVSVVNAY